MRYREEGSLLSVTLIQLCLLALVAVCVAAEEAELAKLLFAAVLLGVLGRIWARLTVRNLSVRLRASKTRLFPGGETVLSWQVKNEKLLPVLWVDIRQPMSAPVSLIPVDEEGTPLLQPLKKTDRADYGMNEEEEAYLYRQRCSLVGSRSTADFETRWKAQRRGLYTLDRCRIYTGDGFGLTRYRLSLESDSQRRFVVYPRIVPVHTDSFLKKIWEGENGGRGNLEDVSVIKLTRPYEPADSVKRLNWRLLARGQEPVVNQYEIVSPKALHFIFDGESWNRISAGTQKVYRQSMEETLEILASLILRLTEQGLECGCSFPATDRLPAGNLAAGGRGGSDITGEILYRMAEYEPRKPVYRRAGEAGQEVLTVQPSLFLEEELVCGQLQAGQYYFVTRTEETAAASPLLRRMEGLPVDVLTFAQLKRFKRGGDARGETSGMEHTGCMSGPNYAG